MDICISCQAIVDRRLPSGYAAYEIVKRRQYMAVTVLKIPGRKKKSKATRTTMNFGISIKALDKFKRECERTNRKHTDVVRFFIDSVNNGTFVMDEEGFVHED